MALDRGIAGDTNNISRRSVAPEETDMSEIHARYISRVHRVHMVIGAAVVFSSS